MHSGLKFPIRRARILAVDDQESQLLSLEGVLADLDHELVCAQSGPAALELAEREEFAVILLDISMPGMDGYETAKRLRKLATGHTPIIFLTGQLPQSGEPLEAYAAGGVDFLVKPYVPEVLVSKVAVFLELFRVRHEVQLQAELLRQSEEKHRAFSELTTDFTCSLSVCESGAVALESLSEAFTRATGWTAQDLATGDPLRIVHTDDREAMGFTFQSVRSGETAIGVTRVITKSGQVRHLRFWARPLKAPGTDRVVSLLAAAQDQTEQRALEDDLRQSQKMEAVGRLAGGVAHDFNNMLTVILGNTQLMLASPSASPFLAENAEQIHQAAERAAKLVGQLLAFSRRQLLQLSTFDLNEVVTAMETMLRRIITVKVNLRTRLSPEPLVLRADRSRIEQVLVNLVVNARDAQPEGGTITIETRRSGQRVMLSVEDTGIGMDAQTRAHIFEPFFTTKEVGKGTGLGLSMVHGVVHQSGGQVDVESQPGQGTTFRIWLPLTAGAATAAAPREIPAPIVQAQGTLLLVEDEPAVRRLAAVSLRQAGYHVIEARTGEEALEVTASPDLALDLVITDVVMPGLNGPELYEHLKVKRPGLKVIYTSGYPQNAMGSERTVDEGLAFLGKPFTPGSLRAHVRKILGQG